MNVNVRNKRKVHSLLTALDELNYSPYMPPQAETRIHGIVQRGKRRRDGQHIEEVKLTFTNIEQYKPGRRAAHDIISNTPGVARYAKVSFCYNYICVS